jgi:hypothetical protein
MNESEALRRAFLFCQNGETGKIMVLSPVGVQRRPRGRSEGTAALKGFYQQQEWMRRHRHKGMKQEQWRRRNEI